MHRHPFLTSLTFALIVSTGHAAAQTVTPAQHHHHQQVYPQYIIPTVPCPPGVTMPGVPGVPVEPGKEPQQPQQPQQPDMTQPPTTAFPQGPPAGGGELVGFNPAMFGDQIGGPLSRLPNEATGLASVPVIGRGAFKIAENESPRPTDRVFINYNYFDRVNTGPSNPSFNLHREVIGFEKTFLEGDASIGMRLPFLQLDGAFGGLDDTQIGDLSIIIKWAFLNNLMTGNVISAGMVVTAPTGDPFIDLNGDSIHPTILQPYGGFIFNRGNAYVHGFSSIVIPTDSTDVTLWLNDIGIGYFLMRDNSGNSLCRGIVPTIEAHLITPLNHRGTDNGGVPDWLSLTGGVNFVFGNNSTLGLAIGVPVTGPRPFDFEGIASLNFRF